MNWKLSKYELLQERGYQCELCGATGIPLEIDHAIYPKARHRKKIKELDEKYNLIITCQNCNQKKPRKYWKEFRSYGAWAFFQNSRRYGVEAMNSWKNRIPLKIKDY